MHVRILKMFSYRVYSARPYSTKNVLLFTVDGRSLQNNVLLSRLQCTTVFYTTKYVLLSGVQCMTVFYTKCPPIGFTVHDRILQKMSSYSQWTAVYTVMSSYQVCNARPYSIQQKISSYRVYSAQPYFSKKSSTGFTVHGSILF
jgi:hypothetical protein